MSATSAVANNHHDVHSHSHDHHGHDHHELSFIQKYIFSTDHKVIARQFMFSALFFLFVGGFFALLIRWQLAYPGKAIPIMGN